jgi:uncharacterized damage-inducible protein DinB
MTRQRLDSLLSEIRALREQTLAELAELTEEEFPYPTEMERWTSVRRLLLRFGDHMREHANQVEDARVALGRGPTMPQRMLAEAELAWGKLLAATLGLSDQDLEPAPAEGSWSVQQTLEHVKQTEHTYLEVIRQARAKARGAA